MKYIKNDLVTTLINQKVNYKLKLVKLFLAISILSWGVLGYTTKQWAFFIPSRPACEPEEEEREKKGQQEECRATGPTRGGSIITALIPEIPSYLTDAETEDSPRGQLTYKASPTFWLYTFSPEDKPILLEFKIRDLSSQKIYEKTIRIEQTPIFGIISFALPKDLLELKVNGIYQWQLSIDGQEEKIEGYLQRKPLPSQLNGQLSPEQRIEWYAENGIWYDLLTELAQLRLQDPNNSQLKEQWDTLLEDSDVDLGYLKQQPLLDCCSVSEAN
ncbi:hypothetical protein CWATWH0402_3458 [Crocosphaera watsonii WH 0402]|uniref:DUF928 domain-containing protein n=1 Tax=Crocosphaera watsonii WH 0402 TaxID=1284629 RepID=T2JWU7_CROWT|nr:DUF928 domain-containing protein [Crocosphaera watsonii]CCQ69685.1 hypothetical protein CWATWH0402_3458 [Crocosphaera watsonii WH 0402]